MNHTAIRDERSWGKAMNRSGIISKERARDLYRKLSTVRQFEEKVDELFREGKIFGTVHTSIGQEAIPVGVAEALRENDLVIATHRGHGHCIMRGADLRSMMAELLGKATGLCKGKGGSMHIVDVKKGMLGAMGIVGAGMPIATGVGVAMKMQKTGQVCACFFGDNASNGGPFHESLNVSALWKLPVVFVCENNLYGLSVSVKKTSAVSDIGSSEAYDIPGSSWMVWMCWQSMKQLRKLFRRLGRRWAIALESDLPFPEAIQRETRPMDPTEQGGA
jgi:pyruvate dehydrogenase E1 component alpha subunit